VRSFSGAVDAPKWLGWPNLLLSDLFIRVLIKPIKMEENQTILSKGNASEHKEGKTDGFSLAIREGIF
jgi:hypothetical protein